MIELEAFSETHRQWFHSAETLERLLTAAGFDVLGVTDEYTNEPADESTLRATWLARRS